MEKLKAHYSLQEIQVIVSRDGGRAFTFTAQRGAASMGLSRAEAIGVVLALTGTMLYKSMTPTLTAEFGRMCITRLALTAKLPISN